MRSFRVYFLFFLGITFLILLHGCARQGYPPGGPVDSWGPTIIDSYPKPESTGVPVGVTPWIKLDEYPGRGSVENAIFISPEPEAGYEVKIRGKKVIVKFIEDLPEDRTVVVTFGAGISDRYGNQMTGSFILAFSTGMMVDNARIDGYIDKMGNPGATWIWGYPVSSFPKPDPGEDKAPFATQPDIDGNFTLAHIPVGEYRLFGVVESRRNRLWDSDREAIALPPYDVLASDSVQLPVNLQLTEFDLIPATLRAAVPLHRQGVRLSFSEPIYPDGMKIELRTEDGAQLIVIDQYQNPGDSSAVLLTTGLQRDSVTYYVQLDGVRDLANNVADSLVTEFFGTANIDTVGARLSWSRPGTGETSFPIDQEVTLGFSEAVILTRLPGAVTLLDPDNAVIAGTWSYPGSNIGIFKPAELLSGNTQYFVQIIGDSLYDIFGNTSPDSSVGVAFTTVDMETLGSLSGRVLNVQQGIHIVASSVGGKTGEYTAIVETNGDYKFADLPAADYRLRLFQDIDGNHQFTPGLVDPFDFAESFWINPDTIRVRARWETEGITIPWRVTGAQNIGDIE